MTNNRWDCWDESWHDEPDEGYCLSPAHLAAKRMDEMYVEEDWRPHTTADLEYMDKHNGDSHE